MKCTLTELKRKELIETKTGTMLGKISDIEIDTDEASIASVIVYGRPRLFGILGRDSDMIIRYSDIDLVGRDTVLISSEEKLSWREQQPRLGFIGKPATDNESQTVYA
ncbi:MAG: YlmC/YmxH family sporulation protein [Oscillospiraceae bacterium]|nr:YlmC/YmxH family sporulation protein [Oscillospiraceae bacterium]